MQSDRVVQGVNYAVAKGAYVLAIGIGVGFFWAFFSLVGFWGFGLLLAMAAAITILKIGIIWFL